MAVEESDLAPQDGRRPVRYTQKAAREICRRIALGESLRRVCSSEELPTLETVLAWLFGGRRDDFCALYRQARQAQAELFADELVAIADDACDRDSLAIAKLRTEVRRWIVGRISVHGANDEREDNDDEAAGVGSHEAALRMLLDSQIGDVEL